MSESLKSEAQGPDLRVEIPTSSGVSGFRVSLETLRHPGPSVLKALESLHPREDRYKLNPGIPKLLSSARTPPPGSPRTCGEYPKKSSPKLPLYGLRLTGSEGPKPPEPQVFLNPQPQTPVGMYARMHARMYVCVHSYIHTYIHTYLRTYIHTYVHTCMRTCRVLPVPPPQSS